MRRTLAGVAVLGLLAGCGGSQTKTVTVTRATKTETTKVEVLKSAGSGARSAFDPQGIYKREAPGVVTILALGSNGTSPFGSSNSEALGSGFVVDGNGYVATNAHVITGDSGRRASQIYVQFADGNTLPGRIVGTDPDSDVGLVKVDPGQMRGANAKLVPLPLGATSELQVGDPVAAIGSPFGEQQSLSVGVVSALNRSIESLTKFAISNAIQTDAAINHGNSGGPLLDGGGRVVGINAQIQSTGGGGEGVGFAIPIETVRRSIDQLRRQGHVDYPYLGISSVSLYPQLAERLGLKTLSGALLDHVYSGGPAAAAGLRGASDHITFQGVPRIPVGSDLITAVDGRKLTSNDLSATIGARKPGDTITLTIVRDGKTRTVRVRLGKRPEQPLSKAG